MRFFSEGGGCRLRFLFERKWMLGWFFVKGGGGVGGFFWCFNGKWVGGAFEWLIS